MYWDMIVSFLLHLGGPVIIATIFSGFLDVIPLTSRIWILIAGTVIFSFIVNFGVLLLLQTTSCDGLKDMLGVAKGAGIGAVITFFFMLIPSYWEGLRLSISQVFVEHHPLLSAADAARQDILVSAARQAGSVGIGIPVPAPAPKQPSMFDLTDGGRPSFGGERPPGFGDTTSSGEGDPTNTKQGGGARMTPEEYANQTFREIKAACAYMAAFAGAYGVGLGSRYAVTCKKV
jgi:hypothetical protein